MIKPAFITTLYVIIITSFIIELIIPMPMLHLIFVGVALFCMFIFLFCYTNFCTFIEASTIALILGFLGLFIYDIIDADRLIFAGIIIADILFFRLYNIFIGFFLSRKNKEIKEYFEENPDARTYTTVDGQVILNAKYFQENVNERERNNEKEI